MNILTVDSKSDLTSDCPPRTAEGDRLSSPLSIPCIVKQPNQPEVKGVIRKDQGDRFVVYIPSTNSTNSISKLFVYPDFSTVKQHRDKSVGQIEKSSSKISTPSTKCSSKIRRKKGEGSGHIYYRTVTRNGKDYRQAYYQWRENGKQRTKYIPKKLLSRVEEAESRKLPIADILVLLVGTDKCSRKKSDICEAVSLYLEIEVSNPDTLEKDERPRVFSRR